ncbi:hypothetical protein BH24GEM2_BH24GEM2_15400 [soil metagenome]
MFGMTTAVIATKWLAARVAQHLYDYSPEETWTTFGLTIPQAAATLAATLIGYELRLFGDAVLNGAIMMILVTCLLGPWVVARYGQQLAAHEERKPYDPRHAPQRILIPSANPTTADLLLQLTLLIREPDSDEPLYPITVVPSEGGNSAEQVLTVRQGSPCWHPAMEHLPGQFAQSVSENIVVLFLSEIERPAGARHSAATA